MKLDPRIKSVSDILTPFDVEKAKEFIGQKGFFANDIECFREGEPYCAYGTLTRVYSHPDQEDPFLKMEGDDLYSFFLPESSLKPIGGKYRPYTLKEFWDVFAAGRMIKFRKQGEIGNELFLILNGYRHGQYNSHSVTYICIGAGEYTLQELFEDYERLDGATGEWKPFGVEVEE